MRTIKQIMIDYIVDHYELITIKPGKCRFNYRCHNNAVHEAVKKGDKEIAMVMYIDGNCPIVHFVNTHINKKGVRIFKDNTLGAWSSQYKYYLIELIPEDQFFRVYNYHKKQREYMRSVCPYYLRIFDKFVP